MKSKENLFLEPPRQIFAPEFNIGAMENVGLVTFAEHYAFRLVVVVVIVVIVVVMLVLVLVVVMLVMVMIVVVVVVVVMVVVMLLMVVMVVVSFALYCCPSTQL